jgi:putative ABC transport system permease protein
VGIAIGVGCALAFGRLLSGLVYGVSVTDPLVMLAVTIVLVASAFLACYFPALRATRTDPLDALRYD